MSKIFEFQFFWDYYWPTFIGVPENWYQMIPNANRGPRALSPEVKYISSENFYKLNNFYKFGLIKLLQFWPDEAINGKYFQTGHYLSKICK